MSAALMMAHWRAIELPLHSSSSQPSSSQPSSSQPSSSQPSSPQPSIPSAPANPDETFTPEGQFAVEALLSHVYAKKKLRRSHSGRRQQSEQNRPGGRVVATVRAVDSTNDIGIGATLRASGLRRSSLDISSLDTSSLEMAPGQITPVDAPNGDRGYAGLISKEDLRIKVRQAKAGTLILFVVDSSGSMGARKRMALVKGAILGLLGDAYRKRDRVAMIVFRGKKATTLVTPTNSVELAEKKLRQLPTGGKTPLAAGLQMADQLLEAQLRRMPGLVPLLVLVTDGRGNVGPSPLESARGLAKRGYPTLVLDSEQGYVRIGDAQRLAQVLNGAYASLDQIEQVLAAVR